MPKAVAQRRDTGPSPALSMLEAMTRKQFDSCLRATTPDEAKNIIGNMITNLQNTKQSLAKDGNGEVDSTTKTDITVRSASITTLIAKILCKIEQKFGGDASLVVNLDPALKDLLVTAVGQNEDIIPLVAQKITDIKPGSFTKLGLVEVAKLLGFAA
ncbi:hypothetical protein FRC11_002857 [Ceratobasidium sp. 423]|nr:hypothetical protein FRC11_002857 [Ceratobasidium sp. 423]